MFLFDVAAVHEVSFISFVAFSEVYMLLTCVLYKWSRSGRAMSPRVSAEHESLKKN